MRLDVNGAAQHRASRERQGAKWCDAYIVNTHAYTVNQASPFGTSRPVRAARVRRVHAVRAHDAKSAAAEVLWSRSPCTQMPDEEEG